MINFFKCSQCGNIVGLIKNGGAPLVCCAADMVKLTVNTVEASHEKHIPEVTVNGNALAVKIGSIPHPMENAHHINFVYVETKQGGQRKVLAVGAAPEARFVLTEDDRAIAVYEYCNLHGLWKKEL